MVKNFILLTQQRLVDIFNRYTNIYRLFTVLFLAAGLVFVFIIPPFQNPDEPMHFYRSYQLATGDLMSNSNDQGLYGGNIPLSMRHLVSESGIQHNFDYGYRFDLNYRSLLGYKYGGEKVFEGFPNTAIYSPFAYIPSILAHQIVALVNGPMLVSLYLARIISLLFVFAAIFFAMKIIPFGRWVLFSVSLLPMTVASSVSLSADAMTIAVSFMLISTTLYIAFSKRVVSHRWHILLCVLVILMSLVKQAHIALIPIIFLIPLFNNKYRSKVMYLSISTLFLASLTCFYVWYKMTEMITINFDQLVQPVLQKAYVLHHPVHFVNTLFQTYFTNNANGFAIGTFGNFGWLTAPLPIFFIIISALSLYWSTKLVDLDEIRRMKLMSSIHKKIFNLALVSLFLLVVGLISVALYLYWTPYKTSVIWGIQGRYFIPVLPLLLLPFLKRNGMDQKSLRRMVTLSSIVVLIVGISIAFGRFYVSP